MTWGRHSGGMCWQARCVYISNPFSVYTMGTGSSAFTLYLLASRSTSSPIRSFGRGSTVWSLCPLFNESYRQPGPADEVRKSGTNHLGSIRGPHIQRACRTHQLQRNPVSPSNATQPDFCDNIQHLRLGAAMFRVSEISTSCQRVNDRETL